MVSHSLVALGIGPFAIHLCPTCGHLPQGSAAVYRRVYNTQYPDALRECTEEISLATAPRQCGSLPQDFYCPLPPGGAAAYQRGSTAHYPKSVP